MSVKRMEALELAEVLGTLMGSVVDAQAQAARATVDFVDEVGFEAGDHGKRMRTVTLRYRKKDENGEPAEFEVEVPLLAMVNIPSLAVSEARLSFSYDVVVAASAKTGNPSTTQPGNTGRLAAPRAATLRGFVRRAPTKTGPAGNDRSASRSTTAIDLDVTLAQQEMPIGVERLFDLAELGISETPVEPSDE